MTLITDLPTDILYIIFPYLDAVEFLALTSCTKTLYSYHQDPNYWRTLTRNTFRIPPQPLLQADGARWQWLYRRLRTQAQLYTWGSNGYRNLGHGSQGAGPDSPGQFSDPDTNDRNIGWPKRVRLDDMPKHFGIVADVQCGGWSTTLLNSIGNLYNCGEIDPSSPSMPSSVRRRWRDRNSAGPQARQLTFPSAYPPTTKDCHEPSTAISQFSTGRAHILGLADDGKVWQWNTEEARLVKPLHVDVDEKNVTRVVAGWDRASMFVNRTGIVYWPHDIPLRAWNTEADAILIDTATVPGTGFTHSHDDRESPDTLEARIGQVTNHILLENFIVFVTSLNKVFLYHADFPLPDLDPPVPIEITAFYHSSSDTPFEIQDLQGSFRSFAIFTKSGSVLMGNRAMLDAFQANSYDPMSTDPSHPIPTVIPALQNNSITSIAFGDHHFQALRSNGTIVAYGTDPQCCGALGLGFLEGTGHLRGLIAEQFSSRATLGHNVGRQVWFDPLMQRWLSDMKEKAEKEGEAKARGDMVLPRPGQPAQNSLAVTAVGDYFEREGKKWDDGVVDEGAMGSYFVLKVAAAGWHTAALVVVDEKQAERARQKHVIRNMMEDGAKDEEQDWHGGTWEDIDAPWDQLSKALLWVKDWIWHLGRRVLGLQERDEMVEAERQKDAEQGDRTRYTWSDQPFPRLRMANGEVMPGEIEVME